MVNFLATLHILQTLIYSLVLAVVKMSVLDKIQAVANAARHLQLKRPNAKNAVSEKTLKDYFKAVPVMLKDMHDYYQVHKHYVPVMDNVCCLS
jgi:hypothetical protein